MQKVNVYFGNTTSFRDNHALKEYCLEASREHQRRARVITLGANQFSNHGGGNYWEPALLTDDCGVTQIDPHIAYERDLGIPWGVVLIKKALFSTLPEARAFFLFLSEKSKKIASYYPWSFTKHP